MSTRWSRAGGLGAQPLFNSPSTPRSSDSLVSEKEEYSDREPVHPGALYEVSFEWERGGDEGLQPESLDWVAARLNELRWH